MSTIGNVEALNVLINAGSDVNMTDNDEDFQSTCTYKLLTRLTS